MSDTVELKGQRGAYNIETRPFTYGRASVLFSGTDTGGRAICVKLFPKVRGMRSRILQDFSKELRAQKNLVHAHILPVIDFGLQSQVLLSAEAPFIILPMCNGGDLREMLRGRAFMPIGEALPILERIASAIDFAHSNGFLHGDIKPENILFGDSLRQVYLSDFGMSKYFDIEEGFTSATGASTSGGGGGGGSTAYLSPEQLEYGQQTPLSDIYSFSTMAFEMVTGTLPFDTKVSPYKQMEAKVRGILISPEKANPILLPAVCKALQLGLHKSPIRRPRKAQRLCFMMKLAESNKCVKSEQPSGKSSKRKTVSTPEGFKVDRMRIFISYTRNDEKWMKEIRPYLKILEKNGGVDLWDESRILPGTDSKSAIQMAIARARVALLIVSADYLASDFIAREELPALLLKAKNEGVLLLQLLASPCNLDSVESLSQFRSVNGAQKTLAEMKKSDRQRMLVRLAETIKDAVGSRADNSAVLIES